VGGKRINKEVGDAERGERKRMSRGIKKEGQGIIVNAGERGGGMRERDGKGCAEKTQESRVREVVAKEKGEEGAHRKSGREGETLGGGVGEWDEMGRTRGGG